jgi:hypothetical protein
MISFILLEYKIYCPLNIENLLPFDIKYSLQDLYSKDISFGLIEKGRLVSFSKCNMNHILALDLTILNTPFRKCFPAIIHRPQGTIEREIVLLDKSNNKLGLVIDERYEITMVWLLHMN